VAAEANISIIAELTGLGQLQELSEKFATTATPTRAFYQYMHFISIWSRQWQIQMKCLL
jgi:hypothetical protein